MAFTIPAMPLRAGIWSGPWLTKVHRFDCDCNLAYGRRVHSERYAPGFTFADVGDQMDLLVAAGTDLRIPEQNVSNDLVEVPLGSGCWYIIYNVSDVGKGFDNEYRIACMSKASESFSAFIFPGLHWPIPMP